jgi:hypothetical protein
LILEDSEVCVHLQAEHQDILDGVSFMNAARLYNVTFLNKISKASKNSKSNKIPSVFKAIKIMYDSCLDFFKKKISKKFNLLTDEIKQKILVENFVTKTNLEENENTNSLLKTMFDSTEINSLKK